MASLGSLVMSVKADTLQFDSSMKNASASAKKMSKGLIAAENSSNRVAKSVKRIGTQSRVTGNIVSRSFMKMGAAIRQHMGLSITAVIASLALAGRAVLNLGRDFTSSMAELSAITGATGSDLDLLKQNILDFGSTTTFTASESATAFKLIGSSMAELLDNIPVLTKVTAEVLTLAEAAKIDLSVAATALGNTLNQFQLEADQAARVVNAFAAASQKGAKEIPFLIGALLEAGPAANAFNISFETTLAVLEGIGKAGINLSKAGTGFRNFVAILGGEKGQALGLDIQVDGLLTTIDKLIDLNLSAVESEKLFGREVFIVAESIKTQRDTINALLPAITGTNVAQEQAAINASSFDGKMRALSATLQTAAITLFNQMLPSLTSAAEGMTIFVRAVTPAISTMASFAMVVGKNGLMAIGLLAAVPLIAKVGTALMNMGTSATAATVSMTGLQKAAGLMFTAFIGFQIGTMLHDRFEVARMAGTDFITSIQKGILLLQEGFIRMTATIAGTWGTAMEQMSSAAGGFLSVTSGVLDRLGFDETAKQLQGVGEGFIQTGNAAQTMQTIITDSNARVVEGLAEINSIRSDMLDESTGNPIANSMDEIAAEADKAATALSAVSTEFQGITGADGRRLSVGGMESNSFQGISNSSGKTLGIGSGVGQAQQGIWSAEQSSTSVAVYLDGAEISAKIIQSPELINTINKTAGQAARLETENTARRVNR